MNLQMSHIQGSKMVRLPEIQQDLVRTSLENSVLQSHLPPKGREGITDLLPQI